MLLKNKRNVIYAIIFGFIFSFSNLVVAIGMDYHNYGWRQFILTFLISIAGTVIFAFLYLFIKNRFSFSIERNIIKNRKYFVIVFLIHFIFYFLIFLAYYPGIFAFDVDNQLLQLINGYNTKHPLLHTLYLQFFYYYIGNNVFGDYNTGIAIASLLQMVFFSASLTYLHYFLYKTNINKKIRYLLIAFTSICPYISTFSISMTKDVFFTSFVVFFITSLAYYVLNIENKNNALMIFISTCGVILFRNNGLYAILPLILLYSVYYIINKEYRKIILLLFSALICSLSISFCLSFFLDAKKGSANEMFSIPYQQIALVYNKEKNNLDTQTIQNIEKMFPSINEYYPNISDEVKRDAKALGYKSTFIKTYVELFIKYPIDYINAFFQNNSGYLYVFDISSGHVYDYKNIDDAGYLLTFATDGFEVKNISYFSGLKNLIDKYYVDNQYENSVILRLLSSFSIPLYFLICIIFFIFNDGVKKLYPICAFIIFYILTLFLGPCALIRYSIPYILCIPVVVVCYLKCK